MLGRPRRMRLRTCPARPQSSAAEARPTLQLNFDPMLTLRGPSSLCAMMRAHDSHRRQQAAQEPRRAARGRPARERDRRQSGRSRPAKPPTRDAGAGERGILSNLPSTRPQRPSARRAAAKRAAAKHASAGCCARGERRQASPQRSRSHGGRQAATPARPRAPRPPSVRVRHGRSPRRQQARKADPTERRAPPNARAARPPSAAPRRHSRRAEPPVPPQGFEGRTRSSRARRSSPRAARRSRVPWRSSSASSHRPESLEVDACSGTRWAGCRASDRAGASTRRRRGPVYCPARRALCDPDRGGRGTQCAAERSAHWGESVRAGP